MCQAVTSSTENLPALPDGVGEGRTHGGSLETGKKEHSQVCQHGQDISGSRGASAERQMATPESRVPSLRVARSTQGQTTKGHACYTEELGLDSKLENLMVHLTFLLISWVILSRSLNLSL